MIDASGEEDDRVKSGQETVQQPGTSSPVTKRRKLTDKEIVAHAVTFMLAGYETTANTLAYTSYLLALNPDIQETLQSEIDSYFEGKPVSYCDCYYSHSNLKCSIADRLCYYSIMRVGRVKL